MENNMKEIGRATRSNRTWMCALLGATLMGLTSVLTAGTSLAFSDAEAAEYGSCGDDQTKERRRHGGPHRGKGPSIDRLLERNAERLGLDEEKQAEIRAASKAARVRNKPLREQLDRLHDEMRELLNQLEPDEAAVLSKADQIGALKTELRKQQLRSMLEIRAMLTPEQRAELVKIHEERRDRVGKRGRGSRGGRGNRNDPAAEPKEEPEEGPEI
jgi:Spy/CpxP family protein refolding chaperone